MRRDRAFRESLRHQRAVAFAREREADIFPVDLEAFPFPVGQIDGPRLRFRGGRVARRGLEVDRCGKNRGIAGALHGGLRAESRAEIDRRADEQAKGHQQERENDRDASRVVAAQAAPTHREPATVRDLATGPAGLRCGRPRKKGRRHEYALHAG